MTAPVALLNNVEQRFGQRVAFSAHDLTIGPGLTFVTGANGSGKSTLLRLLATATRPSSGSISIGGKRTADSDDVAAIRARLGYMPQDDSVPLRQRAWDVVDVIAAMRGIGPGHRQRAAHVYRALDELGLTSVAADRCGALSGGTRRRVALAAAFVGEPSLIVLDEPTAFLDADQRDRLDAALGADGAGATIVVATHDAEWTATGDRRLTLAAGEIVADEQR